MMSVIYLVKRNHFTARIIFVNTFSGFGSVELKVAFGLPLFLSFLISFSRIKKGNWLIFISLGKKTNVNECLSTKRKMKK